LCRKHELLCCVSVTEFLYDDVTLCTNNAHNSLSVMCSYVYRSCSRCPRTPRPKHSLLHFVYCCNTRHIYTTANNAIVSIGTHFSALLGIGIVQNFFFLTGLKFVVSGSYQSGSPYTVYPTGPTVPAPAQGSYIHVYQTAPSVVVIGGCPACRVCSVTSFG